MPTKTPARPRLLMCPPEHFGVEYVINPWMSGNVGATDLKVARGQWQALVRILEQYADIELMTAVDGLPDMCFTANGGFVLGDTFVASDFGVAQRRPETQYFRRWFEQAGYEIISLSPAMAFEGEGDALWWPEPQNEPVLWAGYGVRSVLEAHRELCERLRLKVLSLHLVDERFYHLDTCFLPLPDGRAVYYPAAFDKYSLETIYNHVAPEDRLEVDAEDAERFSCNAVRLGSTLVMSHASKGLRTRLEHWGFDVIVTELSEFIKAGGAAKCLTLLLRQALPDGFERRPQVASSIRSNALEIEGHLLDTGRLNTILDIITVQSGSFSIDQLRAGGRRDQPSYLQLSVSAPDEPRLATIVERLRSHGARIAHEITDAALEKVDKAGVAPADFYSTTIYPTEVRVRGQWLRVESVRMDGVIVVDDSQSPMRASCVLIRDLRAGDRVVCGVSGVKVRTPDVRRAEREFGFMTSGASTERRVAGLIEELSLEMRRIRARGGKIVVVAGPVVIHTGGGPHLARLIRAGFVQCLLTGNALAVHDIEVNLYGTSLGVNLKHGVGVEGGHQHHLRAINAIRGVGSIRAAVETGLLRGGVMYECVRRNVPFVMAGSIRDDGPLPETLMDLVEAQRCYAQAVQGAEMVLMLSSMLHAIATGNMTPAGVHLVCVDISPAVVTKLADRGSVESTGIVTDVGLFLNLLSRYLGDPGQ